MNELAVINFEWALDGTSLKEIAFNDPEVAKAFIKLFEKYQTELIAAKNKLDPLLYRECKFGEKIDMTLERAAMNQAMDNLFSLDLNGLMMYDIPSIKASLYFIELR